MAHFAEIYEDSTVGRVIVVDDSQEHRGQDFIANDLGLGGRWIQTSYNNNFRNVFASVGYIYDEVDDVFYPPQPYPSWTLDEQYIWQPPIPYPEDGNEYYWNEDTTEWIIIQ